ncbi:hypothetical protein TSH100_08220 [Azospirillum sp. TSH100]|uniref:hypothetical protein n=1 Tax=Azospirillum sp. TSH100 TaxID=652764 RepID=UPI000D608425|nr:hypothetical protein [Azospirillum sp. TSH100]PWC88070.1 hypothetical protein TSH100_08220 [Azospirillum sp. TSH100]
MFDPCPFDEAPGAFWSFLAGAAASIAHVCSSDHGTAGLARGAGGDCHTVLSGMAALRHYDALLAGQPAAEEVECLLRRLLGPAMPPLYPVPMAARPSVGRTAGRPVPGLDGDRILLFVGLGEERAFEDAFLAALGRIEVRHGEPMAAVIVSRDLLPETQGPETQGKASPTIPVHVTTHRLADPEPEEWGWLLDRASVVIVPGTTPDHIVAAAEAAARGGSLILQGPSKPWVEAQVAGPDMASPGMQIADIADPAALAVCLRTALGSPSPSPMPAPRPAPAESGMVERCATVLAETVERILRRPAAHPMGSDAGILDLELATYLGSDPAIDTLVGDIERSLPDTVRLTVYTPDGESRGRLGPTARIRPFSAYRAFGRQGTLLCAMSAATVPDEVVNFAMAIRPGLLLRDGYMLDHWRSRLDRPELGAFIDRVHGRPVDTATADTWGHHSMPVPRSFLEPIADGAPRLLVHGMDVARRLSAELHRPVAGLPIPPSQRLEAEELAPAFIAMTRARLGVPPGCALIVSFSPPSHLTALEETLWALHLLRHWRVPVQWHIAAACEPGVQSHIRHTLERLDLSGMVVCHEDAPAPDMVRRYLIASDVGLHLGKVAFGRFAGALVDCIAAGMPSIANAELAASADAPQDAVLTVSDMLSSLDIALALKRTIEAGPAGDRAERLRTCAGERTAAAYTRSLLSHLGWDR